MSEEMGYSDSLHIGKQANNQPPVKALFVGHN
jgi:hypothetical protein